MKKVTLLFILIWILTACAAQPTEQPLNEDAFNWTPAQQAAITALSRTVNLPPGQITLISTDAVDWPDGCLGIQREGVACTEAIVPGYKIILQANGVFYEIRTNEDGSNVVQVDAVVTFASIEELLVNRLASNLGLKVEDVTVISTSEMEFKDVCLEVPILDAKCPPMVVPGKLIVLQADGVDYTYHTNEDGSYIQPASMLLTWKRDGGIAGFCDSLTVYLSGEVYGNQCQSQPGQAMGTFASLLSVDDRKQLSTWLKDLGQVSIDASDPEGVSDRMTVTLEFHGNGKGTLKKTDEQKLLQWAQNLFQKLYS